ncbi:MAG: hypothetical protein ACEQSB_04450, partial [Undibacterium sp.]
MFNKGDCHDGKGESLLAEYVAAVREAAAVKQKSVLADLEYQAASATFIPNEAAINVQKAAINEQR